MLLETCLGVSNATRARASVGYVGFPLIIDLDAETFSTLRDPRHVYATTISHFTIGNFRGKKKNGHAVKIIISGACVRINGLFFSGHVSTGISTRFGPRVSSRSGVNLIIYNTSVATAEKNPLCIFL